MPDSSLLFQGVPNGLTLVTASVTISRMIKSFCDKETARFWETGQSKRFPSTVKERARDKLQMLHATVAVENLRVPPSNALEKLSGDRKGFWSIRINKQYRIVFSFVAGDAYDVGIVDYH